MKNIKKNTTERKTCRISGDRLTELFTLGDVHISDFLTVSSNPKSQKVELKMCLSKKSGLVQLAHTAPLNTMYRKYWYKSGTNMTMTNELKGIAEKAAGLVKAKDEDIWVDIGCNDGTLFRFVPNHFVKVGFDPNDFSTESSKHANHICSDYFTLKNYKKTPYGEKRAKIITAIAMFYDLEDPNAFIKEIAKTLDKDGLFIIQMSYLPLMLKQLAFDNICHEHLEYYSLTSLNFLLKPHELKVVDCELNDINGGSFRIYIQHEKARKANFGTAPYRDVAEMRVASVFDHEKTLKLDQTKTYQDFWNKIQKLKKETVAFIKKEKKNGKKIWGYGASTKGNTLLQWFGLDNTLIDGIAERSPAKYGLKTVGTNIPIFSEEDMRKAKPDYLLVLPWHFIGEFIQREQDFLNSGGKFIVPCPEFEVIGK